MRYPASEKLEIIQLVERSRLPAKRLLAKLGVSRPTFYRWYDLHRRFGEAALADRRSGPGRAWNRIPDDVRAAVLDMALDRPELSPRELAVTFIDEKAQFVSESSVYRLLKAQGLIASPAYIVMKAADEFRDKTTAPNQLWQTDFTYLKVIGWGWFYLSTILDDYSRFIVAWKLSSAMFSWSRTILLLRMTEPICLLGSATRTSRLSSPTTWVPRMPIVARGVRTVIAPGVFAIWPLTKANEPPRTLKADVSALSPTTISSSLIRAFAPSENWVISTNRMPTALAVPVWTMSP